MTNLKLLVFVFAWYCTALAVNLILSCYFHYSDSAIMSTSEFNSILVKDLILSGAIVLVLYVLMRKQLKVTFSNTREIRE